MKRYCARRYKYLVFGAGRVGTAVIYDLIKHCRSADVDVVEPSDDATFKSQERLSDLLGADLAYTEWFKRVGPPVQHDVIISCAPYAVNKEITEFALASNVPMIDLGGNPHIVETQERLARGSDTLIVPECGISPGISNILAAGLAMEGYYNIKVRCGGLPSQVPSVNCRDGFRHKIMFSVEGLLSEYTGVVPIIEDGRLDYVGAMSTIEDWNRGEADFFEASPTSNNAPQVVETLRSLGVKNYNYMTLRYPGHWRYMRKMRDLGKMTVDELKTHPIHDPNNDKDVLILSVEGRRGRRHTLYESKNIELRVESDYTTKFSAMELTTAWGATIVAQFICNRNQYNPLKGFQTPEKFMNSDFLLTEISRRMARLESETY